MVVRKPETHVDNLKGADRPPKYTPRLLSLTPCPRLRRAPGPQHHPLRRRRRRMRLKNSRLGIEAYVTFSGRTPRLLRMAQAPAEAPPARPGLLGCDLTLKRLGCVEQHPGQRDARAVRQHTPIRNATATV